MPNDTIEKKIANQEPPISDQIPRESENKTSPEKPSKLKSSKKLKLVLPILLVLTLVGTVGIYLLRQSQTQVSYTTPSEQELFSLTVDSPKDGELAIDGEILVTGRTNPDSTVAVFTETDETIVESDSSGYFETTVKLSQGINSLNVTAFGENGQEKTESIDVVYD